MISKLTNVVNKRVRANSNLQFVCASFRKKIIPKQLLQNKHVRERIDVDCFVNLYESVSHLQTTKFFFYISCEVY